MWSWVLAAVGTTGIFFLGKKSIWSWLILIFNEILWTTYSLITHQYGFIVASVAYVIVYLRNYREWRKA